MLAIVLLFLLFNCCAICINGMETDFSMLTPNQTQIWMKSISQVNNKSDNLRIEIIRLGDHIEIPLYNDQDGISNENRHLFKQNINKRIDCYVYENQINSSKSPNIYDPCHGTLISHKVSENFAGTYLYTGNQTNYGLGIIVIDINQSFQWYNNTKSYLLNTESILKNGTQLTLTFEIFLYYNTNSDLIYYNEKIDQIIQQSNIIIKHDNQTNIDQFIFMQNLSCQKNSMIIYNDLRLFIFSCMSKVIFKCPLNIGSTCWIEEKRMSNIQLNIDSYYFSSNQTITVRIDV